MQSKYQILIIIIAFDQSGEILNFKNSKLKPQILIKMLQSEMNITYGDIYPDPLLYYKMIILQYHEIFSG